ncbi:MAG: DNA (cytosine-5-)-methyltransferase [Caldilineaceae bacterium]
MVRAIRYIELFAGIGGFRYGIEQASASLDQRQLLSGATYFTCVYANEFDKYASSVYRRHYKKCDERDIRTVDANAIPDHDLLLAGFPCQAFSVAGKRQGFCDTRGTLFFEITRVLRQKRPRLLLLENVKGLLSHEQGGTFATIISALDELGYDLQWQVLNSKDFGMPQNRERVFIVGHLRGTSRPQVFPFTQTTAASLVHMGGFMSAASAFNDRIEPKFYQLDRIYHIRGIARTLMATGRGTGKTSGLYYFPPVQNAEKEHRAGHIRRLTPLECERLQGFLDGWTKLGVHGEAISNVQRYKMLGNAVTTQVVTAIIRRLISGKERHA